MRLILDIDEKTLENMQGYCEQNNIPLEKMITSLFNKHIQEPADVIDELHANGELDKLHEFARMLQHYLSEATYDIQESAASDESYDTDLPMADVFKVLNRDIAKKYDVLTELYNAYRGWENE